MDIHDIETTVSVQPSRAVHNNPNSFSTSWQSQSSQPDINSSSNTSWQESHNLTLATKKPSLFTTEHNIHNFIHKTQPAQANTNKKAGKT